MLGECGACRCDILAVTEGAAAGAAAVAAAAVSLCLVCHFFDMVESVGLPAWGQGIVRAMYGGLLLTNGGPRTQDGERQPASSRHARKGPPVHGKRTTLVDDT